MKLDGNVFRMPFAEWLCCMADADLDNGARIIAIYSAAFNIVGNDQLHQLTGIKSDKTIRRLKKMLLDGGWVIIGHQKGGRGYGVTISPAYKETPVSFTDVTARNPGKYNPGIYDKTPVEITETPVENTPVSQGRGFRETATKSTSTPESPVIATGDTSSRTRAYKEYPLRDINNISLCEREKNIQQAKRQNTVIVNGEAVYGPNFVLDYAAIDMTAALVPFDRVHARSIAEICARDWVANGVKPQNPMAMVKAAILSHHRGEEVHGVRLSRAKGSDKRNKFSGIVGGNK